ncbi:uncharacterized protein LOC6569797 [Drosophila grimshawi]|uniref:GH13974 n=1 Tax=Drosophila grimshawi TaxID=7222 RepID=B4JYQ3_DROGR|nr:uncharacterized protein LOC6569797 [Drosophila grimshawi]EDV90815.1 GH13974 [Drosophila grimshawi]
MYRTWLCLISVLSVASAANLAYLPRQTQRAVQLGNAYYYNAPAPSTSQALRRIIQGHLQRFQQADRQRVISSLPMRVEVYRQSPQQLIFEFMLPPNSPTPKNYAMNFLPEGRDVAPGTSYIPLKLFRIRVK